MTNKIVSDYINHEHYGIVRLVMLLKSVSGVRPGVKTITIPHCDAFDCHILNSMGFTSAYKYGNVVVNMEDIT